MEIRVNRIGRLVFTGTGGSEGGGGNPPLGGREGEIINITTDSTNPLGFNAQVNCTAQHGLASGYTVTIAGNSEASYNVTATIVVTGAARFELVDVLYTIDGTGGTWTYGGA
jgi:hypothetical protein